MGVMMATSETKLMTAEELLNMPKDGYRYELVRGVLKKMAPVGHTGGFYELRIGSLLAMYVDANRIGRAYGANTGFLLERDPDYVLAPDAAFVRQERVEAVPEERGYFPGAPDFVAEVISPTDRYSEVYAKVEEWLNAGARMVAVVNPRNRTVQVYRSMTDVVTLAETDTLDGGDVVPGWRLPVAAIFE